MNEATSEMENLSESGKPPKTRLSDASAVVSIVTQMIEADKTRDAIRAKTKGLVDGNPPYSSKRLRDANQSNRTNVNFREAEGFLSLALSAFYDIFSEVPTFATIEIKEGDEEKREEWSQQATRFFDEMQKEDRCFDFLVQQSQHEMVMFGTGPVFWEDTIDWRCKSVKSGRLKVLDRSTANVDDWTLAAVLMEYAPDQLYSFIRNAKAATAAGWDVKATQKAIMGADVQIPGRVDDWEWHQQQLRNNDLYYSAKASVVHVAHVFFREFSGKITHCIVERSAEAQSFLFRKIERFEHWRQCVCPFYYDMGDGFHHSVKGMGVKFYSALEIKNRLKCALVDLGFARGQILLAPNTAQDAQKVSIMQLGPYAMLPPNVQAVQQNVSGSMDGPMEMERELEHVLQSNLSQYRQRIDKPQGNPRTAFEVGAILNQASSLGKTQQNRYHRQLDDFYQERHRRAVNPNLTKESPGGKEALEYQKKCKDAGIPMDALKKACVQSTRSAGQGSSYLKQQVLQSFLSILPLLPESGRSAVIRDFIAASAGQPMVNRYYPVATPSPKEEDQFALASLEHAALRTGGKAIVTSTQIHSVHAMAHLAAGVEAINSVQQGGDAMAVLAFVGALLEHLTGHMAQLEIDKTREQLVKVLDQQIKNLTDLATQLQAKVEQEQAQAQAQAEQQAQAEAEMNGKDALETERMMRESARKDAAAASDMARKDALARQELAIKDAKAAQELATAAQSTTE